MVFGFFEGSMDIRINGNSFAPGQKITGTVVVNPDKPKQARELRVSFYGEMRESAGGRHTIIRRIMEVDQILSGEKLYSPGESYSFELTVPPSVEMQIPVLGSLLGAFAPHPKFFVHAKLDIPNSADLNKRVGVNMIGDMIKVTNAPLPKTSEEAMELTRRNIAAQQNLRAPPPQTGQPPA